jgi:hypothetical protein
VRRTLSALFVKRQVPSGDLDYYLSMTLPRPNRQSRKSYSVYYHCILLKKFVSPISLLSAVVASAGWSSPRAFLCCFCSRSLNSEIEHENSASVEATSFDCSIMEPSIVLQRPRNLRSSMSHSSNTHRTLLAILRLECRR